MKHTYPIWTSIQRLISRVCDKDDVGATIDWAVFKARAIGTTHAYENTHEYIDNLEIDIGIKEQILGWIDERMKEMVFLIEERGMISPIIKTTAYSTKERIEAMFEAPPLMSDTPDPPVYYNIQFVKTNTSDDNNVCLYGAQKEDNDNKE